MVESVTFDVIRNGPDEVSVITTRATVVHEPLDVLDILYGANAATVVLYEQNLAPDFYDLSTRKLGEFLQKCVNYRVRMAIVGAFDQHPSKALQAFILETNRHGDYPFTATLEEALAIWAR